MLTTNLILRRVVLCLLQFLYPKEGGTGACAGFLKGVGEELARGAGSEVAAIEAICGKGPGKNFN